MYSHFFLLADCNEQDETVHSEGFDLPPSIVISKAKDQACCPYFTENSSGEPVLDWSEMDGKGDSFIHYATWDECSQTF